MIHVPKYVIQTVNKLIFQFLWGSKCEKVKRDTITGYMEYGGLNFPHVEHQIIALRLKWISRLCNDNESTLWKKVIYQWYAVHGGLTFLLNLNCQQEDVTDIVRGKIPSFYQNILEAWYLLLNKCNKISPHNTILWGNDNIRYKGKVLFFTNWIKVNIMYLKDVICKKGFLDLKELDRMLKSPYNLFNLHKLIAAIPKAWKDKIKVGDLSWCEQFNNDYFVLNGKTTHVSMLNSKHFYTMLMSDMNKPICIKYWEQKLNVSIDWQFIFTFKLKKRILNKLGQFQFNLLYNLVPCKNNLKKWKLIDTDQCDFCKDIEDYQHLFVS